MSNASAIDRESDECAICRESSDDLIKNSVYIDKCKCNIYYHKSCLDTWYHNNNRCPVCRNHYNEEHETGLIIIDKIYIETILIVIMILIAYKLGINPVLIFILFILIYTGVFMYMLLGITIISCLYVLSSVIITTLWIVFTYK